MTEIVEVYHSGTFVGSIIRCRIPGRFRWQWDMTSYRTEKMSPTGLAVKHETRFIRNLVEVQNLARKLFPGCTIRKIKGDLRQVA